MQVADTNNYLTADGTIHHNSGKSVGCVMALVHLATLQEPDPKDGIKRSRFAIVRNTYRMLSDTTIKTVLDWLPDGVAGKFQVGKNTFFLKTGDIESEWMFRALDNPEDVRNLLSLEVTGAWINEYREIDPEVLINLIGRIGRYPGKRRARMRSIVMDSNPPPIGSYWYDMFEEGVPDELQAMLDKVLGESPDGARPVLEHFHQPGGLDENAENIDNLPEGYYQLMIAANAHKGEDWINVHVHSQYGPDPSNLPVYPQYRAPMHAPQPFPYQFNPGLQTYLGLDFGKTPAAVMLQQLKNDRWVAFDELVTENCTTEEFIPKLKAWLARRELKPEHVKCYGDPAGGYSSEQDRRSSFSLLRQAGFVVMPGEQAPERRLGAVRSLLTTLIDGLPALMVDKNACPTLAKGFAGEYKFKRNQEGEQDPKPRKNRYSHPHDALQHLLGKVHVISAGGPKDAITTNRPWSLYGKTA